MSFEESPSLDDYKKGLPEKLPELPNNKRRIRLALVIFFGVVLLLLVANFLQSGKVNLLMGTGSIRGRAVDGNGSPFVGDVFIVGIDQIIRTSTDGSFLLESIPAGDQSLVVANATSGQEYPVRIVAGQTVDVGQVQFLVTATPGH
jgi:hypothetical protein